MKSNIIIKDTHRALWYEDGVMTRVLGPGRYQVPSRWRYLLRRKPQIEVVPVDVRERDLTIKGQEILTADKVAIRVSILVQFKVSDPVAALHQVSNHDERLYSDVQLAARRSLAAMTLEQILTNRNQLSEDILQEVKRIAATYGVTILRADVKDLVFPGDLQEIMNKVLAAERLAQAQIIETRTKAEQQKIEAEAQAQIKRVQADSTAESDAKIATSLAASRLKQAQAEAEALPSKTKPRSARSVNRHPPLRPTPNTRRCFACANSNHWSSRAASGARHQAAI